MVKLASTAQIRNQILKCSRKTKATIIINLSRAHRQFHSSVARDGLPVHPNNSVNKIQPRNMVWKRKIGEGFVRRGGGGVGGWARTGR